MRPDPPALSRSRRIAQDVAVAPSQELLERATARERALARTGAFVLEPEPLSAVPAVEPYASNALRTIPPRENGGNLDVAQVREGSRLLLPVHAPGALLSIGDMHFAQGEGEVSGTAIEVAGTITVEVSLRRADTLGWRPTFPAIEYSRRPARSRVPVFRRSGSRSTMMAPTVTWT